ncbi:hypothetical protein EI94DRAFT_1677516 [Lactarius quietus]|nr:hypothetical protein EI94DRAFT_1677516 [Lactarius quietus]
MEQHPHGTNLFADAFHYMFGRARTSVNGRGHPVSEPASQSSLPIQPDRQAISLPGSPVPHPVDEDVDMLSAVHPSTTPLVTAADPLSPSPGLSPSPSLPPSGFLAPSSHSLIDSDLSHLPHPSTIDDDARSDISMPPLYDASDSESGEEPFLRNVYDFMSDSEVDAHDVEMTLMLDDGNFSDSGGATYMDDVVPPPSNAMTTAEEGNMDRDVMVEEDHHLPHTDAVPLPSSSSGPQLGTSSHVETHSHALPYPHPLAHPYPYPHSHTSRQQHPHQHLHLPHPPQLHAGVQLPTFPGMPGLRAQGQGDAQVPLPGLRTLFQPLFVEAVAEAGERLRTAQARGNFGPGSGPATGPDPPPVGANRTGVPVVQVTFNVPVFRVPTDRPRQQQQTENQRPAEQAGEQAGEQERPPAAAPLRADNANAENNPPNPIPDGIPAALRQFIEALDFNPNNANPDGPQVGAPPALTGLLGLLFGLGLGSPELYREDPARAKRLINGLETVNSGLVKRMRKIGEGSADGAICAICWDTLLDEGAESAEVPIWDAASDREQNREHATDSEPGPSSPVNPEEPLPKVVALPCSHVFHSGCLVPWFSRPKQTTCPTCRFNVDPDNLTYEPPRRPQAEPRQPQQQQPPMAPQPAAPAPAPAQPTHQQQQEPSSGPVPLPQQAPQQAPQQPAPAPPPLRRTIFEHTFTIPFPPPFPFPMPQPGNHGPQQGFPPTMDPFSPQAFQRTLHTLRQFAPPMQHQPQPPPDGAPAEQEGPVPPPIPPQPQGRPPMQAQRQGLQPPPQDANANGMPRFPGLFQFELPQVVHMPDDTWFWAAPLGDFTTPMTAARPPHPPTPRVWAPPPPPGLTLRQRVEQGEREQGLRCDDMSCGVGPSDDDPEPTADLERVVIHEVGNGHPACDHLFHPACLVSAERVAGWAPEDECERERTALPVEVSCPLCRAVGAIPYEDWKKGVHDLA